MLLLLVAACGTREDLAITGVEPADTSSGLATPLVVSGRGFAEGAALHLMDSEGRALAIDASVSTSGDRMSASVPPGLSAGEYDIRLVNPGGHEETLRRAFTVYDGGLEVFFLDVGQGDATFIRSPRGDTLLKDGGTLEMGQTVVVPFLDSREALPPTHMIASHRHGDHLGGLVAVLEGPDGLPDTPDDLFPEGLLLHNDPFERCISVVCGRYDAVARGKARVAELGEVLDLGAGVRVEVVAVGGRLKGGARLMPGDENATSVAVVVKFGDLRVFVGGDLTGGGYETTDMETPLSAAIAPIHVLRTNHHGSASSTNHAFTRNLGAGAAVVSAGEDNPYCHPHRSVMSRLQSVGARIFLTTPALVHPNEDCSEPTYLPPGTVVADGHIELRSDDGRGYAIGPAGGELVELTVH